MEISHSLKREIIKANEKEIISSQALKYLAKARTINEFKEYLKSLNSPPEFSAELVADFVKKGYLNDRLYAENILNRYQKKYAKENRSTASRKGNKSRNYRGTFRKLSK